MVTRPIHNRLPVLRAERGLSRKDLAQAIGVNYQTVGYLERGDFNPSLELAMRLAEYFGVSIESIFAFEPFKPQIARPADPGAGQTGADPS